MTRNDLIRFLDRRTRGELALMLIVAGIAIFTFGIQVGEFLAWIIGAVGS